MKHLGLILFGCSAAAGATGDWVAGLGGSIARDTAGEVVEVRLRGAWAGDSDLSRLREFPKLRKLDLSHTHINDQALDQLKPLKRLSDLDLSYAEHITDAGLARLRALPALERLSLEGTRASDSGIGSLALISTLRSLNLRSTLITDSAIEQLEPLSALEELSIGANRIAGFGLVHLQALPKLKHLDLSGVQLTDDGVWSVALTDLNVEALTALKGLESLNASAIELTGVSKIPDGGTRESTTIQLTDLGIEKLSALRNLRRLEIARARVTARGLRRIAALPSLQHLSLAHTGRMDEEEIRVLAAMKQLQVLDLSGVPIASDAAGLLTGKRVIGPAR